MCYFSSFFFSCHVADYINYRTCGVGCSDLLPGSLAVEREMHATSSRRWTPTSRQMPLSTSWQRLWSAKVISWRPESVVTSQSVFLSVCHNVCWLTIIDVIVVSFAVYKSFYPNVTYTFGYMLSQIRPSVCRLSVCNFHAPYSAGWNFRQCFYAICTLAIRWRPCEILRRSYRGTLRRVLNARGVAKYSDVGHVEGYISETVQDTA